MCAERDSPGGEAGFGTGQLPQQRTGVSDEFGKNEKLLAVMRMGLLLQWTGIRNSQLTERRRVYLLIHDGLLGASCRQIQM